MSDRPQMEMGDWVSAAFNVVIGALVGSAAYGLLQLVVAGAWVFAVIIAVLATGFFLFVVLSDKLFDFILPTSIRPAKTPGPKRPKPLVRVLSLPLGFLLGVALAAVGLDRVILDLLA